MTMVWMLFYLTAYGDLHRDPALAEFATKEECVADADRINVKHILKRFCLRVSADHESST